MRIPLSSFEQHIDETSLERGLKYFESGAVGEVEELSPGEFEAEVDGSETYSVSITLKRGYVEAHSCDCPYDGPVCKHVVAVLFHLQQDELDLKVKRKKGKGSNGTSEKKKPTTVMEKVANLVDAMPHEELKDFVLMRCTQDATFRRVFQEAYEERKGGATHAAYAKRIKAAISANGGRGRANGWYAAKPVSQALQPMIGKLNGFMADGAHALALPLATALLNELNKAMEHIDDSNGYLSMHLETALEALRSISEAPADEHVRKELLAFAIAALHDGRYSGWNWHSGMMAVCAQLVRSEEEAAPVLKALQRDQSSSFANDDAREHEMEIIRRLRGDAAADEYMNAHLDVSDIREQAIEAAIAQKRLDRAWQLATEGYEKDRVKLPGLAAEWARFQLRIAGLRGEKEVVVRLAREQVLACNDVQENMRLLEKTLGSVRWPEERERLLQELLKVPGWRQREAAAELLAGLERWKDLLVLSRAEGNGSIFNQHVDALAKHFCASGYIHLEKADALLGGMESLTPGLCASMRTAEARGGHGPAGSDRE